MNVDSYAKADVKNTLRKSPAKHQWLGSGPTKTWLLDNSGWATIRIRSCSDSIKKSPLITGAKSWVLWGTVKIPEFIRKIHVAEKLRCS